MFACHLSRSFGRAVGQRREVCLNARENGRGHVLWFYVEPSNTLDTTYLG
jgi:hypothetical protein